jgi:hypothetical protein
VPTLFGLHENTEARKHWASPLETALICPLTAELRGNVEAVAATTMSGHNATGERCLNARSWPTDR